MKLIKAEKEAIKLLKNRDYEALEKFIEKHNFDSGLMRAIWNFSTRLHDEYLDEEEKKDGEDQQDHGNHE